MVSLACKLFLSCRMYINRLWPTGKMQLLPWVAWAFFLVCASELLCCREKGCTAASWYCIISLGTFMLYQAAKVIAIAILAF